MKLFSFSKDVTSIGKKFKKPAFQQTLKCSAYSTYAVLHTWSKTLTITQNLTIFVCVCVCVSKDKVWLCNRKTSIFAAIRR